MVKETNCFPLTNETNIVGAVAQNFKAKILRSGVYDDIGTGDVLFYMYNNSTENWHYEQRRIVIAAELLS